MPYSKNKQTKLKKLAAISSVSVAVFLCAIKGIAFLFTGSLAVLSSFVDSLSDIAASLVTFFAIRIAVRPASVSYRYGYGKVEALSTLFQSAFISVSGLFILYDALLRLKTPQPLQQTDFGLAVMVLSLLITLSLVVFQRYVAKKTNSLAVLADSAHYSIDILTNVAIILSLFVIKFWNVYWIDSVSACFISLYLLYNAYSLSRGAVFLLLDKELNDDIRSKITNLIKNHPLAPNIHDLRTRDIGGSYIFELHLELDGNMSLYDAHTYTEEVENILHKEFPTAQIIIHQDPKGIKEKRLDNELINTK